MIKFYLDRRSNSGMLTVSGLIVNMPVATFKPFKADWKDASQYPPVDCQDPHRIAWEFVRRNPDYAVHAQQMLKLVESQEYETGIKRKSLSILDGVECWPAALAGETAKDYYARIKVVDIKRPRIDKPCNSFANRWALKTPVDPSLQKYSDQQVVFIKHEVKIKRHKQLETKAFSLFIYPNEIAARFRLDLPIKPQTDIAFKKLEAIVKEYSKQVGTAPEKLKAQLASIANRELADDVLGKAHYILRSYDASKERRVFQSDKDNNKRAFKSGPKEQTKAFNVHNKSLGQQIFLVAKVKEFPKQAAAFIEGKKFLLLLWPQAPKRSTKKTNPF